MLLCYYKIKSLNSETRFSQKYISHLSKPWQRKLLKICVVDSQSINQSTEALSLLFVLVSIMTCCFLISNMSWRNSYLKRYFKSFFVETRIGLKKSNLFYIRTLTLIVSINTHIGLFV